MSLPSYELEARASEQRKQIHLSLNELQDRVRKHAALKPVLRRYWIGISGSAALLGLMAGYGAGRVLQPRKALNAIFPR